MKEVLGQVERWRQEGRRVALARVVGVDGSGPRQAGATMAVSEDGEVAGSVSGGCVEGAVVTEALAALEERAGARRCSFGYSDDDAFAVGLTCGGTVHLLVDPELPTVYDELRTAIERSEPVVLATVTDVGDQLAGIVGADCAGPTTAGSTAPEGTAVAWMAPGSGHPCWSERMARVPGR